MAYEIHKIKDEIKRLPVRLLYVTHSSYDKGWHSRPHSHDFVELFYIVKGEGAFVVNDSEYHVEKDQLVIIDANVSHTEKSSNEDSLEYITLGFDGITFGKNKNNIKETIIIYEDTLLEIFSLVDFLLKELKKNQDQAFHISRNILEIIILKINQFHNVEIQESSNQRIKSNVYELIKYIDLNYSEWITLDDLANISHLNKYYLSHTFKNETGLPPIDYLNQTRIKNAKILLESTNYSISDIAGFTGFSSQSFFSQRFKKMTSVSPSKYREQQQADLIQ